MNVANSTRWYRIVAGMIVLLGGGPAGCQIAGATETEPGAQPASGHDTPNMDDPASGMAVSRTASQVDDAADEPVDESNLQFNPEVTSPWFLCGNLAWMDTVTCQLPGYSSLEYEYAVAYNSREPLPAVCTYWNRGVRLYNKEAYFVYSDNPTSGMRHGGFMFYTGTDASDDDTCPAGQWRHRYWYLDVNNGITAAGGNGCYGSNLNIYCRAR